MGNRRRLAPLILDDASRPRLAKIAYSPNETKARSERALVLIAYAGGTRVCALAQYFQINRCRITRIIKRALDLGVMASLEDTGGTPRPARTAITFEPEIAVRG